MILKASLTPVLLMASCILNQAWACGLPDQISRRTESNNSSEIEYPFSIPGDDVPSDPATKGYFINHLCINARNATETINWYTQSFGLRLMFTLQVSKHFSISYMGHSHGGRNGTGYQSSAVLASEKNNREGLLEIISLEYPVWDLPAGIKIPNTFSHIGMVVPNITATQERLESLGANILKAAGEEFTIEGPFADATGFTQAGDAISKEEKELILKTLVPINTPLMFVADPDGNIIEVQNQEGSDVF